MPRFLCDEMLGHLCRYLRAAGYDALLADSGKSDRDLLAQCKREGRYFLTLDRRIMEHKAAADSAILLPQDGLDGHAALLNEKFALDWTSRAFTRCLVDNAVLEEAALHQRRQAPADADRGNEVMRICPQCGRLYWQGSHYRRMLEKLQRWQGGG